MAPKTTNPISNEPMVVMAILGRAHGLRGEIGARSFTADPLALGDYGALSTKDKRTFEIASIRVQGAASANGVVVKLKGIEDRTAAEKLNGLELFLPRSALPEPDDDDDFYHADLIGLRAINASDAALGTILAVHNFGAGDMLELRLVSGAEVYVPFTKAAVPTVSIKAGHIILDEQAAGLVADAEDDVEAERGTKE
jgi:16S rRNA processing protein RimM